MNNHATLQVVIDGIIFELQSRGGISHMFNEIIPKMCEIEPDLHIRLLNDSYTKQALPKHLHVDPVSIQTYRRYLRPEIIWRPILTRIRDSARKRSIGNGFGQLWHSTYYTLPSNWAGFQVVTVYDMIYELFRSQFITPFDELIRVYKRRCIQNADVVICISESTKNDLQEYYQLRDKDIRVIYPAYSRVFKPFARDEIEEKFLNRKPFFLYVGKRLRNKNFKQVLRAYSVWPHRDSVDLRIVDRSAWSLDELLLLARLGLGDSVHLDNNVNDVELSRLYNLAEAFIFPSLYEGFGIPLLEAMACGCPIIASRIPSTIEVAGEIPFYFDPNEVDDLCKSFDLALSFGKDTQRIQQGFERVKEYSWDKTARQTLSVYRDLLSANNPA